MSQIFCMAQRRYHRHKTRGVGYFQQDARFWWRLPTAPSPSAVDRSLDRLVLAPQQQVFHLADAVKATLGPNGRNVIIERGNGFSDSTKDGVTVARHIFLSNPLENIGAQTVKEVAELTVELAGDGTTTATVLAQALINAGIIAVESGDNPVILKKGIELAVDIIVKNLIALAEPVKTKEELIAVATISTNNDPILGKLIGEAMDKVTLKGQITIEPSHNSDTYFEIVPGFEFNRPFISDSFINNEKGTAVELYNPLILITDRKLSVLNDVMPYFNYAMAQKRPLLVVAHEVDGEVLGTMILNSRSVEGMPPVFPCCAVRTPGDRDTAKEIMQDLAYAVNGMVISEHYGINLATADPSEMLGTAKKVVITKQKTLIVTEGDEITGKQARLKSLEAQLEEEKDEEKKEYLKSRIATLIGGVGVIHVGGKSDLEKKERIDRVDDAINAVRSAMEEGIVPGAGVALIRAFYKSDAKLTELGEEYEKAVTIVAESVFKPFRTILENSGYNDDRITAILSKTKTIGVWDGYNSKTESFQYLKKSGVVDPVKVVRVALENAASVAATLIITECVISIEKTTK
jgi:chaperonin GroEL